MIIWKNDLNSSQNALTFCTQRLWLGISGTENYYNWILCKNLYALLILKNLPIARKITVLILTCLADETSANLEALLQIALSSQMFYSAALLVLFWTGQDLLSQLQKVTLYAVLFWTSFIFTLLRLLSLKLDWSNRGFSRVNNGSRIHFKYIFSYSRYS